MSAYLEEQTSPIIQRDGKFYLVQTVSGSNREGWDDFDTCVIEITPEAINAWRSKIDLAKRLKAEHGIDGISFVDYSAQFYPADWDAEPLDENGTMPPDFSKEPGCIESERLHVGAGGYLFWRAYPKYSDYPHPFENYGLYKADLDRIEKELAEMTACTPATPAQ